MENGELIIENEVSGGMRFRYRCEEEMKDSGVEWLGKIPENWVYTKLKMLTNHIGRGKSPDYVEKSMVKVINQACIYWDSFKFDNVKYQNEDINYDSGKVYKGDLLINSTGTGTLGRARNFNEDGEYIVDSHVTRVRCNDINYSLYLGYLIKTELYQRLIYSTMVTGSTNQIELSREGLRNMIVPNMSNEELKIIIKFLDKKTSQFDTIISKKEALIQTLEEAKKSLISEVVTGKVKVVKTSEGYKLVERKKEEMKDSGAEWLGEIPKDWKFTKLKYEVDTTKGFAFKTDLFVEEGIPVIKASDIKNGTVLDGSTFISPIIYSTYEKVSLKEGNIIMSTVGSTPDVVNSAVGQLAMVPKNIERALLNQNTVILKPRKNIDNNFLFLQLNGNKFRKYLDLYAHGTANQASLSLKDVLDFPIPITTLDEQKLLVKYLKKEIDIADNLISNTRLQIQKLKEAKQALISETVTGKIEILD